jgi:hypothetical protein
MKTENIKDEVSYDMEKRIKQKQKTQWKVTPGD